ncbi:DUF1700 domain-containing protein [Duganella sp. FT134W]|uniref:DUF1700 domain-containing protein n=1 Tax=Duganella margarita TaxID=2692170 RepID=A0A7X4KID5_9BURK|nr:DUF1700 domain-containing protein [Duganella margarita]MYM75501.1 DUF1700 domain-containing protein [Duganella margarita]
MNKQAYLASMRRSLTGLPADQVEDILRDYEQHFIDAMAAGRSDQDTAIALGDPRKLARELKAMSLVDAFQTKRSLGNFWRMGVGLICMVGFNAVLLPFMLIPPLMLLTLYLTSICCFIGGAAILASGLSGVDKITYDHDGKHMALVIKETGLSGAAKNTVTFQAAPYTMSVVDETVASVPLQANSVAPGGEGYKSLVGLLYVASGIALLGFNRKLAGYCASAARRYLKANANLLRGARTQQR